MDYEEQNFEAYQVLNADDLNQMEDTIATMSNDYEKQNFTDGMILEAKHLNHIEDGIAKIYESGEYEAGRTAYESDWWDSYQNKGKRVGYQFAFAGEGWTDKIFKPKYDIKPIGYSSTMFQASCITDLAGILEAQGVTMDLSKSTSLNYMFPYAKLTHIPRVDGSSSTDAYQLFYYCQGLHTVDALVCHKGLSLNQAFYQCTALEKIVFEGTIDYNALDLHWSPLSSDSLWSLVRCLEDKSGDTSGTEWKVIVGSGNISRMQDGQLEALEAKGWAVQ